MCAKPMIGLNMDYRPSRNENPAFSFLCSGYYDSLIRCGAIPVAIPPLDNESDVEQLLNMLDAFVMVGGEDLDPNLQGYERHSTVRVMDRKRESFDRLLIAEISRRKMPLLAIGSGMQLLNVYEGGSLYFDISEDLPKALPHMCKGGLLNRHALTIKPGTFMETIYGDSDIRVNSRHHQCICDVAVNFEATGWCPDGVIEVIESQDPEWFAVGTQFHPECSKTATALDMRIFEEFIANITGEVFTASVLV
ncbi:MAG: gamma-glutamyl-gamma-aminobutyrate hydrolase family protein [Thermoguttaceae bacterium]|nr:gamma-glutamyl-gamma-aminobutyrate hydrolase family protein [Thermoguttaceae bacterium]